MARSGTSSEATLTLNFRKALGERPALTYQQLVQVLQHVADNHPEGRFRFVQEDSGQPPAVYVGLASDRPQYNIRVQTRDSIDHLSTSGRYLQVTLAHHHWKGYPEVSPDDRQQEQPLEEAGRLIMDVIRDGVVQEPPTTSTDSSQFRPDRPVTYRRIDLGRFLHGHEGLTYDQAVRLLQRVGDRSEGRLRLVTRPVGRGGDHLVGFWSEQPACNVQLRRDLLTPTITTAGIYAHLSFMTYHWPELSPAAVYTVDDAKAAMDDLEELVMTTAQAGVDEGWLFGN